MNIFLFHNEQQTYGDVQKFGILIRIFHLYGLSCVKILCTDLDGGGPSIREGKKRKEVVRESKNLFQGGIKEEVMETFETRISVF